MVDLNVLGEELLQHKGKLRELELRLEALLSLLEKEGIVTKQEVEQDFKDLTKNLSQ